jgi:beta-lactamase regulating signal transducer with metallopeptidase domain
MNTLLDELFSLQERYPGMGTLCFAAIKALLVLGMASSLSMLLRKRSARARCWVWRGVVALLLFLAAWTFRPHSMTESGLVIPVPAEPMVQVSTMALPVYESTATLPQAPGWKTALRHADAWVAPVWLGGSALLLVWALLVNAVGMRRLRRGALPVPEHVASRCPAALSCYISGTAASPLLTGSLRPKVWLPETAKDWSGMQLHAAFSHELAHHMRRDVMWQQLATLGACLWWWLPMSWHARVALRAQAEEAADDYSVTHSVTVPDYAEALVNIAAEGCPDLYQPGIAMTGCSEIEQRVRQLLRHNPWRDRIGRYAAAAMLCSLVAVSTLLLASCQKKQDKYLSMAKLVATGRVVGSHSATQYLDYLQDFYGTIIETLESAEMRRRALERVRALNPDMREVEVEIRVTQNKGSAIFNLSAIGAEPKYTRVFLDALLDEFKAFRDQAREMQRNKALVTMADDVARKEGHWKSAQEKLTQFLKQNDLVVLNAEQATVREKWTIRAKLIEESEQNLMQLQQAVADPGIYVQSKPQRETLSAPEAAYMAAITEGISLRVAYELANTAEGKSKLEANSKLTTALLDAVKQSLAAQVKYIELSLPKLRADQEATVNVLKQSSSLIAQHEALKKAADLADLHYREMFEKVKQFQMNEDMTTDVVTIMEKASAPIQFQEGWW